MNFSFKNISSTGQERISDVGVKCSSIAMSTIPLFYILYKLCVWFVKKNNKLDYAKNIFKYKKENICMILVISTMIVEIMMTTQYLLSDEIHNLLSSFVEVVYLIGLLHFMIFINTKPKSEVRLPNCFIILFLMSVAVRELFCAYGMFEDKHIESSIEDGNIAFFVLGLNLIESSFVLLVIRNRTLMLCKGRQEKEIQVIDPCPTSATQMYFKVLAQKLAERNIKTTKIKIADYNANSVSKYAVVICNNHTRLGNDAVEAKAQLNRDLYQYILFNVVHFVTSLQDDEQIPTKDVLMQHDQHFKEFFDVVDILFFYRDETDEIAECAANDISLTIIEKFARLH